MSLMKMPMFTWTSLMSMILVITIFRFCHDDCASYAGPFFGMHFFTLDAGNQICTGILFGCGDIRKCMF